MIPEDLTEFLYWVKEKTETLWSEDLETSGCDEWIHGAKWLPLTDEQIDEVERKYSIQFTPDHKEFLRILHTIDRKEKYEYTESFDDDAEVLIEETPFFYNWLEDDDEIKNKLNWPFEEVLRDIFSEVNSPFWCKSWGERPKTKEEIIRVFTHLYEKAPKLIPITSHRFVVSDMKLLHKPILSVWGTDTIIYGWTIRTYLLNEIRDHLDIIKRIDYEDGQFDFRLTDEALEIHEKDFKYDESKVIPFWQEIILSYNTGWSGFGMECPFEKPSLKNQ